MAPAAVGARLLEAPSMTPQIMVTRSVESHDPSLSDETNEMLTAELRAVIGSDSVQVPESWPDHSHDRHATHTSMMASAILLRIFIAIVGFMLAMTALIAVIATSESWAAVALTTTLFLPTTWVIATLVLRTFNEFEHVDPELAAILTAEGVGDPDRTFTDLVHDFRPESGMTAAAPS
ncbi:MAG: hypothetical protein Q7T55_07075 [Solirubrobacteraceae bacterium]|nr:hypothetical protein [Solirubrobacteraceae bacterium]